MTATRVKVGIVGLGRSGWSIHALTLQKLADRYQVVAVADPDQARRQEAEQTFGCRAYASTPELFADAEVELVVVASPNHLHAMHTVSALEAGKAVVCEKPMAASLEQALAIRAAVMRAGVPYTIVHNIVHSAPMQAALAQLAPSPRQQVVVVTGDVQTRHVEVAAPGPRIEVRAGEPSVLTAT